MTVTCWAESLGGCSSVQSREHYISKGLFEGDSIIQKGLPWCKFEEKEIGLASASAKILCKTHNERLSILDDEAIRAFDSLREILLLQSRQKKLAPRIWKVRTWHLNGLLLDRWFLKTLVNLMHVQTQAIEFRGLRVVLAWTDKDLEPFIRRLGSSVAAFDGWRESRLLHPFRGMNFDVGARRAQVIKIAWPPFRPAPSGF